MSIGVILADDLTGALDTGAELSALLDAVNAPILFVPAFPDMNRGMRGGVIYIDGLPVAESIFGKDPFNPVKHSRVEDILHATAGSLPVAVHDVGGAPASPAPGVHAMNASTNEELRLIAESAKQTGITVFAGCAGFARHLPYVWGLAAGEIRIPPLPQRLLVFSGSMNGITTGQLQYGRSMGIPAYTIGGNALSDPAVFPYAEILRALGEGSVVIVEAVSSEEVPPVPAHAPPIGEEARRAAAEGMGEIAARLIRQARGCLPLVIGGDTLLSTMQNLRCQRLYPLQSIATGTVLALADTCLGQVPVVTKSGGLGPLNIMEILLSYIQTGKGGINDAP